MANEQGDVVKHTVPAGMYSDPTGLHIPHTHTHEIRNSAHMDGAAVAAATIVC